MTALLGKGETKVVFEVVLHPASIIKPKIIHHMRLMDEKHIAHPLMVTAAQRPALHLRREAQRSGVRCKCLLGGT
jgi:hypothetical protein